MGAREPRSKLATPGPRKRGARAEPDPPAPVLDARFSFALVEINAFELRHLVRVYAAFEGDLTAAIILGEIAHHNVSQVVRDMAVDREALLARIADDPASNGLLPCNAYSIAASTGIPYETVRRKTEWLVRRGWLARNRQRELFITRRASDDLQQVSSALVAEFLSTAEAIFANGVPGADAEGASPAPSPSGSEKPAPTKR